LKSWQRKTTPTNFFTKAEENYVVNKKCNQVELRELFVTSPERFIGDLLMKKFMTVAIIASRKGLKKAIVK
jgi:hypothetical protein